MEPELQQALDALVSAARDKDAAALWAISPAKLHSRFDALAADLVTTWERVQRDYPAAEQAAALESLGEPTLKSALVEGTGAELFAALTDFTRIGTGEAVDRGLAVSSVTRDGDTATLKTQNGESFRFVREGDAWKAAVLLDRLDAHPTIAGLGAHVRDVKKVLDGWVKTRQESVDPKRPEGAFNVAMEAIRRTRRVTLFEMLEPSARAKLDAAFATVEKLQKAAELRYPTLAERKSVLDARKLAWIEGVPDAKALFVALFDAGAFADDVPATGNASITAVRSAEAGAMEVVSKEKDKEWVVRFSRAETGEWKLAALTAAIQRESERLSSEVARPELAPPVAPPPAIAPDATAP